MPTIPIKFESFAIAAYRIPSITAYNRLEPVPRAVDFERSLKAEVRDALWMLTRQWQFGELQGEDAATAMSTKIVGTHTTMDQINFGSTSVKYDGSIPLEAMIEREKIVPDLHIAIQMARYFSKLIRGKSGFDATMTALRQSYPLEYIIDKNDYEGQQMLYAAGNNSFDGFRFYQAVLGNTVPGSIKTNHQSQIDSFVAWHKRTYSQPDKNASAWMPSQLDYRFEVSASADVNGKKLTADHYAEGHLDWFAFDISNGSGNDSAAKEDLQSYIPTPVTFKGMPHHRFWMMEENRTDFGKVDVSPTGLLHLLLAEFALTCSNDWFVLPYQLPVNSLCEITGILVKDVFGEYTLVRAANKGTESQWQRWTMFHHTTIDQVTRADHNAFYLPPAVIKTLEGEPLEKVNFMRDEMANMVWAVENIVPSQAGKGVRGDELARNESEEATPRETPGEGEAKPAIRYVLGTTVPRNWIPFIPVHVNPGTSEIQLQRASMPFSKGAIGRIVKETPAPHYIAEEMIPRAGVQIIRNFQMARTSTGSCCLWIGREKQSSTGEVSSSLKFDQIIEA